MESPEPPQILPPPPTEIPPNVVPIRIQPPECLWVFEIDVKNPRPGSKGKRVSILTNHFDVSIANPIGDFYHYDLSISYKDCYEITQKNIKMAVIEKLYETYKSELAGKALAFDGVRSLFTHSPLPLNNLDFSVVLNSVSAKGLSKDRSLSGNDEKRQKLMCRSKIFKVQMIFVSQISMESLNKSKNGRRLVDYKCLRVLDTILRQQALKQCIYDNNNTTRNQNVKSPFQIEWTKASRTLKNLRFRVKHLQSEFKITGLSESSCKEQKFSIKLKRESDESGGLRTIETTVYDYFVKTRGISLKFSENLPCINAGKPHCPTFFPIELCHLVPLQHYKNELSNYQRSALIAKSSQKPEDLIKVLSDDVRRIKHETQPLLQSCGISISSLVQVEGRILSAPQLKMGNGENIVPRNAWWSINDKMLNLTQKLLEPKRLEHWAIVNFSTSCDARKLCVELAKIGSTKGMVINPPLCVFEENPKHKKKPPSVRVEMMFKQIQSRFRQEPPQFILCLLANKKFCDLYGPWKRKTIIDFGIHDQCLSTSKVDERYMMNVLLKINVKLGGINHTVVSESTRTIPLFSKVPTMIFGIDVSHAAPGRTRAPSIASVIGSREWPRISSYRASLRALPPKVHMIDSLFNPMSQQEDAGIVRELLLEFYSSSGQKKPSQLIIFRNGLSALQFNQMLRVEMDQILKACYFLEENWRPKFTVIVSQRQHHTKFFDAKSGTNIFPGTTVDNKICDFQCNNFYMSAHAARIGTSRPTHYHVLLDEIGFSSDDLQEFIHSLSYVFQRSNNAISEVAVIAVAPVRYAQLAAAKISQLHKNVLSSMFFI
ncbi:Translation initiation factor 2C (eIF-2C) [Handroanthus impetiginosus]|uniref:Translation initiation factor 2C (eIF-2C) n=1 Tax=Handroanthus impetiginosus TaxID=429701 RepID=A0A2G9I0G8_9LAMI|nr:Translation initiation factor 2C (eIF-2C) [Handroanthus impetiginosus]